MLQRLVISLLAVIAAHASACAAAPPLPRVGFADARIVAKETGEPIDLVGINLGNWLLLEPWMFGIFDDRIQDEHTVLSILRDRFGAERAEELIRTHRDSWITRDDIVRLKNAGFNLVRVPVHHRVIEDESRPMTLREDAFEHTDRLADWCEELGVYIIFDLHAAAGGQGTHAPTGRVDENDLWTDTEAQDRLVWFWRVFAERYAGRTVIAAHDLLNEPYGDFVNDIDDGLFAIMPRAERAIHAVDPEVAVLLPGSLNGVKFYGDVTTLTGDADAAERVGFTDHYYPGVFHVPHATLTQHADTLRFMRTDLAPWLRENGGGFLVGEYNPIFERVGGARTIGVYLDTFRELGWASTMWCLKTINPGGGLDTENWGLFANAEPWSIDLERDSFDVIRAKLAGVRDIELDRDEPLVREIARHWSGSPARPLIPRGDEMRAVGREVSAPDGFRVMPVGAQGSYRLTDAGGGWTDFEGGGRELWGAADGLHFIARPVTDDGVSVVVGDLRGHDESAKAGVMLRRSTDAGSACVAAVVFPDGRARVSWRDADGEPMRERTVAMPSLPARLSLRVSGDEAVITVAGFNAGSEHNERVPIRFGPGDGPMLEGVCLTARSRSGRAVARVRLMDDGDDSSISPIELGRELLANPSFERGTGDTAAGWNRWGDWLNRENTWRPVRTGDCIVGYHHWRIITDASSGLWQDVGGLTAGDPYRLTAQVSLDPATGGAADLASVELRLEVPDQAAPGGALVLNARTWDSDELPRTGRWVRLSLDGIAPGGTLRAVVSVTPASDAVDGQAGGRGGALRIDDVSLRAIDRSARE